MAENSQNKKKPDSIVRSTRADETVDDSQRADLIPLFRLLARQPPPDHDFRNCPICKRHGITNI